MYVNLPKIPPIHSRNQEDDASFHPFPAEIIKFGWFLLPKKSFSPYFLPLPSPPYNFCKNRKYVAFIPQNYSETCTRCSAQKKSHLYAIKPQLSTGLTGEKLCSAKIWHGTRGRGKFARIFDRKSHISPYFYPDPPSPHKFYFLLTQTWLRYCTHS